MRSIGFSFHLGGLGVQPCSPDVAQPFATVSQWGSAERVSLMTCDALFSLALCANRSFSSLTCRFAAQAQCFGRLRVSFRCRDNGICDPGVIVLRCPAWQARDRVCAGAVFVGPVAQSARFRDFET